MSKLANMLGGSCSDIISVSDDSRKELSGDFWDWHGEDGEDGLQRKEMMRVKIKQDDRKKLTPIEYLTETGTVPELDWVRAMKLDDLTGEDAKQLLDAGCSKRKLLQLYGVSQVGGVYYAQLDRLLGIEPKIEPKTDPHLSPAVLDPETGIFWLAPKEKASQITITDRNVIRIGRAAVRQAPPEYRQGCRVRIGMGENRKSIIVQPIADSIPGGYDLQLRSCALGMTSKHIADMLRREGIKMPVRLSATWSDALRAWVGTL